MNEFILERYYRLVDERESQQHAPSPQAEKNTSSTELDHQMALRLQLELLGPATRRARVAKPARKRKTGTGRTPNTAFNAQHALSSQLLAVVGGTHMSRPQVVKQLWAYIREHGLQNANDKRKILCDEKLQAVFGKKTVGMFEMNKLLGKHLFKDEELVNGGAKVEAKAETEDEFDFGSDTQGDTKMEFHEDESEISDVDD